MTPHPVLTAGTFTNQVTATGQSPGGAMVADLSTDGTDPDPNGDGDPGESTPSTVSFQTPRIGAAKQMSANGSGPWTVTIAYAFENLGDIPLTSLSAADDLTPVFGAPGTDWSFLAIASTGGPASFDANMAFTGVAPDSELIAAGSSLLPGETGSIEVTIEVETPGNFVNQLVVTGEDPLGGSVSDTSDQGTDPDANGDGIPDEGEPSTLELTGQVIAIPTVDATGLAFLAAILALAATLLLRRRG